MTSTVAFLGSPGISARQNERERERHASGGHRRRRRALTDAGRMRQRRVEPKGARFALTNERAFLPRETVQGTRLAQMIIANGCFECANRTG